MTQEMIVAESTELDASNAQDVDANDSPELSKKEHEAIIAKEEKRDLRSLEGIITKGDRSLALMAEALTEIRDRRLYKRAIDPETQKPFKAFAKYLLSHSEWGFTAQYANRLIANLRDQKAIEAGEEPEPRKTVGSRDLEEWDGSTRIKRSFDQFVTTIGKYRDSVVGTDEEVDAFRADFDKMYGTMEKAMTAFLKNHRPEAPAIEDEGAEDDTEEAATE